MPVKDGITATRELRSIYKCRCRIIGYTAFNMKKDVDQCLKAGMDEVLNKPSPPSEILRAI